MVLLDLTETEMKKKKHIDEFSRKNLRGVAGSVAGVANPTPNITRTMFSIPPKMQ